MKAIPAWITLTWIGTSVTLLAAQPAPAQISTQSSGLQQEETDLDFLTNPENSTGSSIFGLINRVQALQGRQSFEEFAAGQANSLDTAAAKFREQQRQLIQTQQQTAPSKVNQPVK